MQHINDKIETARIAGAAAGVTLYGLTLNEWVAITTIVYVTAQFIVLTPKIYRTIVGWREWVQDTFKAGAEK